MDLTSIVALAIVILTVGGLIGYSYASKTKKRKRDLKTLQEFAGTHNSTISEHDRWPGTLIGTGTGEANMLFFIRTVKNETTRVAVPLAEVMDCRLVKEERVVQNGRENISLIDKINLVFTFFDYRKSRLSIEFYNNEYDHLTISNELQIAQKWQGIVKEILSSSSAPGKSTVAEAKEDRTGITGTVLKKGAMPGRNGAGKVQAGHDRQAKQHSLAG